MRRRRLISRWMNAEACCAAQTRTERAPTSAEQVDGRLRLGAPLEALGNDRLVLGEIWLSSASRAASSEIAVIDDHRKAKTELLLVMLTGMSYYSLPQENSDQPLVFQVTRVSSAPLKVSRRAWPAPPKTVGLHLSSAGHAN